MSLSQLSFIKERISDELKKNYIGGGYGTIDSPYTWNEYQDFLYNGNSSLPAFYFDETGNRQRHEGDSFGADPNWHQDGYPLNLDISRYLNLDLYLDDIKRNDPNFTLDQPIYFYGGTVLVGGVEVLSREDAIALVKSLYSGGSDNCNISFNSDMDKQAVSDYSIGIIKDIMKSIGDFNITITSTIRTPEKQAEIMLDNIISRGKEYQKKVYGVYGDKVIDVYDANLSRKENLDRMISKIYEVGPRKVSRHCGDYNEINVFDIAGSSIDDISRMKKAFNDRGIRCLSENGCLHVEINQIR